MLPSCILFLLVQNRQQTHDSTLIGLGANCTLFMWGGGGSCGGGFILKIFLTFPHLNYKALSAGPN